MWDDEVAGGAARDPEGERPGGGDRGPQWNYKCERLNKRVQARYRQFPVNLPGGEAEPFGEHAMQGGNLAEGEFLSPGRQFDLEPGIEVDVEAAPIAGIDQMGMMGTPGLSEPRQVGGTELAGSEPNLADLGPEITGSEYDERQGLRAIFATESDRLAEAAGELTAEARQPEELMAQTEWPGQPTAETGRLEELTAQTEWLGQPMAPTEWSGRPAEIPQVQSQDTGQLQVREDRAQGQIIWKSFPKPLREKGK